MAGVFECYWRLVGVSAFWQGPILHYIHQHPAYLHRCLHAFLQAILRPWRLDGVINALNSQGIRGLTVSDVSGIGFQGGMSGIWTGRSFSVFVEINHCSIRAPCINLQGSCFHFHYSLPAAVLGTVRRQHVQERSGTVAQSSVAVILSKRRR